MITYRITTNGTRYRLEMLDSRNNYHEWMPCQTYTTLAEAKKARDLAARPAEDWTPVDGDVPVEVA